MIGGSIIIPILRRTLATTISIIKKGTYKTNPIIKAVLSSLMTNAGMRTDVGTSAGFFGFSAFAILTNRADRVYSGFQCKFLRDLFI